MPGAALTGVRTITEGGDGTLWFVSPQGVAHRRRPHERGDVHAGPFKE